ncbi:hypothetical protein PG985_012697 [Apiospora marii]|uniref:uncharacterized protein n=1 Tax=Apiospora marii TaxID=335849 RepID=UPI00312D01EC
MERTCNQEELAAQNSPDTQESDPDADAVLNDSALEDLESYQHRQEFTTLDLLFDFPEPVTRSIPSGRGVAQWGPDYIPVSGKHISAWDDFTEKNINLMFHDFLLGREYRFQSTDLSWAYLRTRATLDDGPYTLRHVAQISTWFTCDIWPVVDLAIGKSAEELQERVNSGNVLQVAGGQERVDIPITKGNRTRVTRPKWIVYYEAAQDGESEEKQAPGEGPLQQPRRRWRPPPRRRPIVPCDFEEHMRFDPAELADPARMSQRVYAALGKTLMHCVHAKTRYAFVEGEYGVHYIVLPWAKMEGRVFAWKGIWALVMLSLNDQHRPIASEDETRDLNDWARFEEKGQTVWANHISKIVVADGEEASDFHVVDAPREEFAAQLAQYSERQIAGSLTATCQTVERKNGVTYRIATAPLERNALEARKRKWP